jgi:hypothetical protein
MIVSMARESSADLFFPWLIDLWGIVSTFVGKIGFDYD